MWLVNFLIYSISVTVFVKTMSYCIAQVIIFSTQWQIIMEKYEKEYVYIHYIYVYRNVCVYAYWVTQLCLTLCDPMDCSPPGFSVQQIFQARILEWVALSSSMGSFWPRSWTPISMSPVLACRFFTTSATRFFTSSATETLCYTEEGSTALQMNYFFKKDCLLHI